MINTIQKLEMEINRQLEKIQLQLNELENANTNVLSNDIYQFIKNYQDKEIIDFSLLESILLKIKMPSLKSFDEYKSIVTYLDYCKKNNIQGSFNYDIQHCMAVLKNLIDNLN